MMLVVCKFGGTSLANAAGFKRVRSIMEANPERKYMVISAPGRINGGKKVTDLLIRCHESVTEERIDEFEQLFEEIAERFLKIEQGLSMIGIEHDLSEIRTNILQGASLSWVVSRGEYVNALLFSRFIKWPFLDAAHVIRFEDTGTLDLERTQALLHEHLKEYEHAVIPGFYGSDANGTIHLFPRGGSDITGALVAAGAKASLYENWTDVPGLFRADPELVPNACLIALTTYEELEELGYLGAEVFHAEAVSPVRTAGIPIAIRNTFAPTSPGTLVVPDGKIAPADPKHPVTGITGRKEFTILIIKKAGLNKEVGFLAKLLEAFAAQGVNVEHVPTGFDRVSVVFKASSTLNMSQLHDSIRANCGPDIFWFEENISLIAVVGRGMIRQPGIAGRVFQALGRNNVNVYTISQGADEMSIVIGVSDNDYAKAIRSLHDEFR